MGEQESATDMDLFTPAPGQERDTPNYSKTPSSVGTNSKGSSQDPNPYRTADQKESEDNASTHFWTVFEHFDWTLITVIFVCNFAQGFRRLLELGLYIVFKEKLNLQAGEITLLLAIMALPWIFKFLMAIMSDSVTLCGTRRKSYLIINSILNIISIALLMALGIKLGKIFIMFCIVTSQICMTWCDSLSDALIAQAARFDL